MEETNQSGAVQPQANQNSDHDGLTPSFQLFKPSWEAIKLNLSSFLILVVLPFLYFFFGGLLMGATSTATNTSSSLEASDVGIGVTFFVYIAVGAVISVILAPALAYLSIKSVRGVKVEPMEAVKAGLGYFWRYIGLSIVVGVIIVIGFLLLIVPGVIMMRRYLLSVYYLIDRDLSISEAMKQSADESKKYSGSIYGIIGVFVVTSLLSIVPFIGGIVGAVLQLMYTCGPAKRYDEITKLSSHKTA